MIKTTHFNFNKKTHYQLANIHLREKKNKTHAHILTHLNENQKKKSSKQTLYKIETQKKIKNKN